MDHSMGHGQHTGEIDWTAMAAQLELDGEVPLPYVTETAASAADEVRRCSGAGQGHAG